MGFHIGLNSVTPSPSIALFTMRDQSLGTVPSQPSVPLFRKISGDKAMVSPELAHKCGQEKEVVLSLLSVLSSQLVKNTVLLERWGWLGCKTDILQGFNLLLHFLKGEL